jgi:UV DNA damage endonuclease
MIRLGYVGINTQLPSPSRTFRLARYSEPLMLAYAESNIIATWQILRWNDAHDIKVFRISSAIVPFASHPINQGTWRNDLSPILTSIGAYAREKGMRLSMHPGQYTVLNARNEQIFRAAMADLDYHAALLELMDMDCDARLILHCGGSYGDKGASLKRLEDRYLGLPDSLRCRLALENDEKVCCADILDLCLRIGCPGVFDLFHHKLHPGLPGMSEREIIEAFSDTWPKNERQKIHYSDQNPEKPRDAHADHIDVDKFIKFYDFIADIEIDVMLEVKDKERSVLAVIEALKGRTNGDE